jgi:hypothetical protein
MMERLTAYDRPFFGRADSLLLGPLNPAEVGDALSLGGGREWVCGMAVPVPRRKRKTPVPG